MKPAQPNRPAGTGKPPFHGLGELRFFLGSIRFRLTLWMVGILAVILAAFSVFVYTRQAYELQLRAQTQLQLKSQQLDSAYRMALYADNDSDHASLPALSGPGSLMLPEYAALAFVLSDGSIAQSSGPIDQATVQALVQSWQHTSRIPGGVAYTTNLKLSDEHDRQVKYLFLVSPLLVEHKPGGLIVLGRPLDPDDQLPRLLLTLLFGSLATLLGALAGGYWIASRAMSPVRTITRAAQEIGETDLHRRLRLGSKDELGELANTFDGMLDRLQAAFDRQRQFTADASHELRTPLTIVGLEADQALQRKRSTEEYERALKVIKSENEFMAHLVNDLLTLARMDAGQTHLRAEALDLSDLALEVVERLSALARVKGVELHLGELPETPVQGDRQFLSQALANLVENAIKYAGGRGKHVRLETGVKAIAGRPWAWIQVEDDGPGIPGEHVEHLFDRFYRVDAARARTAEGEGEVNSSPPDGSGLGLSIVHWIVREHGGEVSVQSQPGAGTTFEIRLPFPTTPSPKA